VQVLFRETELRALIPAVGVGLALATSAQAARLAPKALDPATYFLDQEWAPLSNDLPSLSLGGPPAELVSGGCGWGWHRHYWKDRWGNVRPGRCVRNWWCDLLFTHQPMLGIAGANPHFQGYDAHNSSNHCARSGFCGCAGECTSDIG
jgi:hypothetical protein